MLNSIKIATTGLLTYSKELQNISHNVANLNTPGFKSSNSKFASLMNHGSSGSSANPQGQSSGGGVTNLGQSINFAQGPINSTGNDLDAAIDGNGFFVVKEKNGNLLYTRNGAFKFNGEGYLVDQEGNRVQGFDAQGRLQDISFNGYLKNSAAVSKSILLTGKLSTADTEKNVSGVSVFDAVGGSHDLTINFKNNSAATTGSWLVTIKEGTTVVATGEIKFINGNLDPAKRSLSFTYSPVGAAPLALNLNLEDSVTSISSGSSSLAVSKIDGYGTGELNKTSFDDQGNIVFNYTNGQTLKNQSLAIANFASTDNLVAVSGNKFKSMSQQDGVLTTAANGMRSIEGGSIEGSNVDLSKEFSQIIITQRAYQAASELISTANQMMDTLLRMKG